MITIIIDRKKGLLQTPLQTRRGRLRVSNDAHNDARYKWYNIVYYIHPHYVPHYSRLPLTTRSVG